MRLLALIPSLGMLLAAPTSAQTTLTKPERTAAFRSAGFSQTGSTWRKCDDPGTAGYTPGAIEWVRDLNGDGLPEALVTEGSSFCHGAAEAGFTLVSKQAKGPWKAMVSRSGFATFLNTRGTGGWPDLEVGGPGFCFPVERWDGREYHLLRKQYDGKPCKR
mgnify:CR=1 FL=1